VPLEAVERGGVRVGAWLTRRDRGPGRGVHAQIMSVRVRRSVDPTLFGAAGLAQPVKAGVVETGSAATLVVVDAGGAVVVVEDVVVVGATTVMGMAV